MKSTVLDCRVCNPKVRITNPIIGITYPILVIGSTQSLHRAIQGSTQNLHRAKESYTESTQSNSEPKRLYKAYAGSTHSVMQYYKSKQSKFDQIFDEFYSLFLTMFIFFSPSIISIIILNSLHLKMFPLHFYHHARQFTSQQHSASNSFRTFDLEVMRPAFSHWATLLVHIKLWKVLSFIAGLRTAQNLELLIQYLELPI